MRWESKNYKEKVPSIWELKIGEVRIVVHKIIHYPGWYLSCYYLNIENKPLDIEDVEQAKNEAVKIIIEKIEELNKVKEILINHKKDE